MNGKVWLVGAGPSDQSLLTLKGRDVLEKADVVIYDQLVDLSILLMIPEQAEIIDAGKYAGNHTLTQDKINELLVAKAKEGKKIVRLKGGDPFVFGRGGEEIEALVAEKIDFEVVPGITSSIAVPAYAGIPVTHRDYTPSFHVVTAHRKRGSNEAVDYKALAGLGEVTLVFLMGIAALDDICQGLIYAGVPADRACAVIQHGARYNQRIVTGSLGDLPEKAKEQKIGTPGIIIVGDVVSLQSQFHWANHRRLGTTRVIVTRPKAKGERLSELLREQGAEVLKFPATKISPVRDQSSIAYVKEHAPEYEWIVFTSEYAVEQFFHVLQEEGMDIRTFYRAKYAAIGEQTANTLKIHGIFADLIPTKHYGDELAACLLSQVEKKSRILTVIPANVESGCYEWLKKHSIQKEIICDAFKLYQTEFHQSRFFSWKPSDIVTFASSQAVDGFALNLSNEELPFVTAVCIGKHTWKRALDYGMQAICAKDTTMESIVDRVVEIVEEHRQEYISKESKQITCQDNQEQRIKADYKLV